MMMMAFNAPVTLVPVIRLAAPPGLAAAQMVRPAAVGMLMEDGCELELLDAGASRVMGRVASQVRL